MASAGRCGPAWPPPGKRPSCGPGWSRPTAATRGTSAAPSGTSRWSCVIRDRGEERMSSQRIDITVPGRPEVHEVSAGVFAYVQPDGTWWINNTGFITGSRGVTSIDTCSTERRTRAYLDAIRRFSDRPVRTLVNTHHHGDHTYGNCLLPAATVIGHELTREEVLASGPPL